MDLTKLNVKKIRGMLKDKGWTVEDLAYWMGISPALLGKMLRRETVQISYVMDMACILGVTVIEITLA